MIRRFATQQGSKLKASTQKNPLENSKKLSQDEIFIYGSKDSSPGNNKIHIVDYQEKQKDDSAYYSQQSKKSNSLLSDTNHATPDTSHNQSQHQYDIVDQFQVAEQRRLKSDHQKRTENDHQKKNDNKEDILMEIFKLKEKLNIVSLDEELAKFERKQIEKMNVSKTQLKNILEPKKNTLKIVEPKSPTRPTAIDSFMPKPKPTIAIRDKPSRSVIQDHKNQSVDRNVKTPLGKNTNCFDKVNKFLKNSEEILIQENQFQRKAPNHPMTPKTKLTLPSKNNVKSVSPKRQFENHIKIDMVSKTNPIKEINPIKEEYVQIKILFSIITEIQRSQNSLPAAQKQEVKQYQFQFTDIDQLQFQNKEAQELRKKALEEIKQEQQDKSTSTIDFLTDLDASLQIQIKNQTPLKQLETQAKNNQSQAQTEKKQQQQVKQSDKNQVQTAKPRDQQAKKTKLQGK